MPIDSFGYPKHEGEEELVILVRSLVRRLTGKNYEHILITQGCTHALNAYVAAQKEEKTVRVSTRKLYFPFYPGIAQNHGLIHSPSNTPSKVNFPYDLEILDSPSNPEGVVSSSFSDGRRVWDAAYYSPTYGVRTVGTREFCTPYPPHEAMAGSLSKLTGINGIRIGWLATNDQGLYDRAARWATLDTCGISLPSQWLAKEILTSVDMEAFWDKSKLVIDSNRTEVEKLSKIFGDQTIPDKGMFALFEVDSKLKELLDRSMVVTTPGQVCGDDRDSVRINLAHTNAATRAMVKTVLKNDKIK